MAYSGLDRSGYLVQSSLTDLYLVLAIPQWMNIYVAGRTRMQLGSGHNIFDWIRIKMRHGPTSWRRTAWTNRSLSIRKS
jgi:hypothetical protein